MARILRRLLIAVVAVVALGALAYSFLPWADLRSETVEREGASETARSRGRALLRRAAEAHGLTAWRGYETVELVAVDRWASSGGTWPDKDQRFRAQRLLGTFTSRVELLDGPKAGEIWGIQDWAPYRIPAGTAEVVFLSTPDPGIEFYLPTLQYFDELPFRLLSAETVAYAGASTLQGRRYERVFVTWGDLAAHPEHDQYEVWIDPESRRIEKVTYTVRDAAGMASALMRPMMRAFAIGTMHYEDYREVQGVLVAFKQSVTLMTPEKAKLPLDESYFHQLTVESVRFDAVDPALLTPDPGRGRGGDAKPS